MGLGLGRDPERTPMQWDSSPHGGFTPAAIEPWLPIAPDAPQRNVATQTGDNRSMLAFTKAALSLRRARPSLHAGDYRACDAGPPGVFVFERTYAAERCVVALNLTGDAKTVAIAGLHGKVALRTTGDRPAEVVVGGLTLRPHEGVVVVCES